MTTFSDRLKEAMYAQNLKQIDLVHIAAENNVKLGKSHVSQYVSGKTVPRNDILHFLADTLHVDADWLLGDSQENFTARENNSVAPKAPSTTKTSGSVGTSNSSKRGTTPMKKTITDKNDNDNAGSSAMHIFKKSSKLDNVLYDVRGPVVEEAARMEERGTHVLKLNIGNPAPFGFRTPDEVIYDMSQQLSDCEGYSPSQGLFSARKAIMQYSQIKKLPNVTISDIYTGNGVSELINLCMSALLDNGDEILIPSPDYPLWTACATLAGGKAVHYICDEQSDWYPDIEDMRRKITDRTKALVIINPNNPTGAMVSKAELQKWVDYANKVGAIILYDAAYEAYISEKDIPHSIYECEGARTCAIEMRSFSKNAGFTGMRLGFTVIPKDIKSGDVTLHSLWARRHGTKYNGAPYIIQRAGEAVYSPEGKAQLKEQVAYYMKNAKVIYDGLKGAGYTVSGGVNAPYIWLKTPGNMTSWEFFDHLLADANVVGTPGSGFGPSGEGYFRLTAFGTYENTVEAVERIKKL